jgi:hypothetical protein
MIRKILIFTTAVIFIAIVFFLYKYLSLYFKYRNEPSHGLSPCRSGEICKPQ